MCIELRKVDAHFVIFSKGILEHASVPWNYEGNSKDHILRVSAIHRSELIRANVVSAIITGSHCSVDAPSMLDFEYKSSWDKTRTMTLKCEDA